MAESWLAMWQEEGRLWQACGVLAAAGALRSVVLLLRRLSMPDCAAAFVRACTEAGLKLDPRGPLDSGRCQRLYMLIDLMLMYLYSRATRMHHANAAHCLALVTLCLTRN